MATFGNYNMMNMFGTSCIGGNNMFSSNMFGMNMFGNCCSSIFGNMFGGSMFTNCDGSTNYDAMAGFAVGGVLINIAGSCLLNTVADKKANSQESLETNLESINNKIDTQLKKLKCSNETEALSYSIDKETDYQQAITTAQGNFDKTKKEIEALDTTASDYDKKKKALESRLQTEKKELDNAKRAKTKREDEINTAKVEIQRLIQERDKVQEQINDSILDKADGTILNRSSKKTFNKKFDESGKLSKDAEVSKGDLRYAILGYSNAVDENEKAEWKSKFEQLYRALGPNDRSSFKAAAKLLGVKVVS